VNYKTTITFSQNDPKIKSGFTANLKIQTMKKDNVLILPQYAIVENDRGAFVKKMNGGNAGQTTEIPVTLGIRSQNGMVEIIDGVAEGDRVLNVGIKTK
jgi:multidrug efflux pump subunit AcrA (membrane-fusion protein)